MKIKIEYRECNECGHDIEELDQALVGEDGVVLCQKCVKDWLDGAFVDAIEWIQSAELVIGAKIADKYLDDDGLIAPPRGRETA